MFVRIILIASVVALAASHFTPSPSEPGQRLPWLFRRWDRNHDTRVDAADLRHYFNQVEEDMGDYFVDSIQGVIARYDADGDQLWSLDEVQKAFGLLDPLTPLASSPEQIHLMMTGADEWTVMWVTKDTDKKAPTTVNYGLSKSALTLDATGSTHTYTAGNWEGTIHEVVLAGLRVDTQYFYRVGGEGEGGWSDVLSFRTRPASSNQRATVYAIGGDMGVAIPAGFEVCKQMERDHKQSPFDMVLHVGDLAYASTRFTGEGDDEPVNGEEQWIWDMFVNQISPLASVMPYVTGVGNHEKFYNYSSYLARFQMPAPWGGPPLPGPQTKFWFSFDYGQAHWVFMSTEHDYNAGSDQYNWMVADLRAARANPATPWIFLTGHRPMYSTDSSEYGDHRPGAAFQEHIEPLMLQYGVDGYFCGHMHMFERIHPVRNGTVTQSGSRYVNPGAPFHVVQGTYGVFQDEKYIDPQPAWSAKRMGKLGYGRITIFNQTTLHYEFKGLEGDKTEDEFWLTKN